MKAVFAGSFDPFTLGHLSVVIKASQIFDEVTVILAKNDSKKRTFDSIGMANVMMKTFEDYDLDNVYTLVYDGLIANYCKENNIEYLVRGIRNSLDFQYEESISAVNKLLNPNLKTIYIPTDDKYKGISSSMVRELLKHDSELVYDFVPIFVGNYLLSGEDK